MLKIHRWSCIARLLFDISRITSGTATRTSAAVSVSVLPWVVLIAISGPSGKGCILNKRRNKYQASPPSISSWYSEVSRGLINVIIFDLLHKLISAGRHMLNHLSQVHRSVEDSNLWHEILRPTIMMDSPVPQTNGNVSSRTTLFGVLRPVTAIIMASARLPAFSARSLMC